jgi:hypothetical protein
MHSCPFDWGKGLQIAKVPDYEIGHDVDCAGCIVCREIINYSKQRCNRTIIISSSKALCDCLLKANLDR